ncbi:uncharacterized protein BXZ73DRAFT_91263 [Epithele typhae]|uniref:uncharacterized protein n=1 Tax=Epithele typhae TaxID=378194 RepID=UPI00200862C0|nr:uncharacterized protein BXZ73DRAFT_91263 [Epithele typhae]KAH9924257.1 hypothetical protein BXZ73DRAFT_91263 [Epithele typhae]
MVCIKSFIVLSVFSAVAAALPAFPQRREVPQEHSHEAILRTVRTTLNLNNPDKIVDPVFSLLGDAAAKQGAGSITDLACFQQAVADQAFTNAKTAGDSASMINALMFRAVERNTGGVGVKSALCTQTAKNPEVAAITQHQDPASDGAAATNKAIVLALAKEIAKLGGDPQLALQTGTFAPGSKSDNTGKGNSCDDANDATGCIISQKLLVEDATAAEINAAVAGISGSTGSGTATSTDCADATVTVTVTPTVTATVDTAATCAPPSSTVVVTVTAAPTARR